MLCEPREEGNSLPLQCVEESEGSESVEGDAPKEKQHLKKRRAEKGCGLVLMSRLPHSHDWTLIRKLASKYIGALHD